MNDYFLYESDMSPHEIKKQWIEKLCPGQVSELFNYMPDTLYFVKDLALRLPNRGRNDREIRSGNFSY